MTTVPVASPTASNAASGANAKAVTALSRLHFGQHAAVGDRRDARRCPPRRLPRTGRRRSSATIVTGASAGCATAPVGAPDARSHTRTMPSLPPVAARPRLPFSGRRGDAAAMTEERQRRARRWREPAGTSCSWPLARPTATHVVRSVERERRRHRVDRRRSRRHGLRGQSPRLERRRALRDELRAVGRQLRARHGQRACEPQPVELGAGDDVEHLRPRRRRA